jgi:hypothetical protein
MVRHRDAGLVAGQVRKLDRFGYSAGVLTLLFFMSVALIPSIIGRDIRCSARFPIVAVLALGTALATGAIGGSATAKGNLPIPGVENRDPIVVATSGGIAVLFIVLLVGYQMYVKGCKDEPATLPIQPEVIILVPEGATLGQTITIFEKITNANVDSTQCSADALARPVQSGEIRAKTDKQWLELLSQRVRGNPFKVNEIMESVRYAIACN